MFATRCCCRVDRGTVGSRQCPMFRYSLFSTCIDSLIDWPGSTSAASIAVFFFSFCRLLRVDSFKRTGSRRSFNRRKICQKNAVCGGEVQEAKCKRLTPSRLPSAWYLVISKLPQVLVHDRSDKGSGSLERYRATVNSLAASVLVSKCAGWRQRVSCYCRRSLRLKTSSYIRVYIILRLLLCCTHLRKALRRSHPWLPGSASKRAAEKSSVTAFPVHAQVVE